MRWSQGSCRQVVVFVLQNHCALLDRWQSLTWGDLCPLWDDSWSPQAHAHAAWHWDVTGLTSHWYFSRINFFTVGYLPVKTFQLKRNAWCDLNRMLQQITYIFTSSAELWRSTTHCYMECSPLALAWMRRMVELSQQREKGRGRIHMKWIRLEAWPGWEVFVSTWKNWVS